MFCSSVVKLTGRLLKCNPLPAPAASHYRSALTHLLTSGSRDTLPPEPQPPDALLALSGWFHTNQLIFSYAENTKALRGIPCIKSALCQVLIIRAADCSSGRKCAQEEKERVQMGSSSPRSCLISHSAQTPPTRSGLESVSAPRMMQSSDIRSSPAENPASRAILSKPVIPRGLFGHLSQSEGRSEAEWRACCGH